MQNDLLGVLLKVVMEFLEKLLITPFFNFLDGALFGSKDPLT